jgi:hypothetical protein
LRLRLYTGQQPVSHCRIIRRGGISAFVSACDGAFSRNADDHEFESFPPKFSSDASDEFSTIPLSN